MNGLIRRSLISRAGIPGIGVGRVGIGLGIRRIHDQPKFQTQEVSKRVVIGNAILRRIPKFLQPFSRRFLDAPVTHVTSFIILHELTAIIPLIGIWWVFHNYHDMIPNWDFTSYGIDQVTRIIDKSLKSWDFQDYSINEKANFIMEGAYSYIIVKTLAPIRIMISLSMMPFFSKWVIEPIKKRFGKKKKEPENKLGESTVKQINKPRL